MPKVRNISPKKERDTGEGRAMMPFTHSMDDFFKNRFLQRWMEGFFEPRSAGWPFSGESGEAFEVWPKTDILDRNDAIVVRAEMPGVKKEDLEVTIAGDRLTLEAKRSFEEEEKDEEYFRSEISCGRLFRAIRLPVDVKGDEAKAELKDGVVEIYLPKVEATTPHKVKVA